MADNLERCNYYITRGVNKNKRCSNNISKIDPEHKFCSSHRRCDYPESHMKRREKSESLNIKQEIKLLDFITFKKSCIDYFL